MDFCTNKLFFTSGWVSLGGTEAKLTDTKWRNSTCTFKYQLIHNKRTTNKIKWIKKILVWHTDTQTQLVYVQAADEVGRKNNLLLQSATSTDSSEDNVNVWTLFHRKERNYFRQACQGYGNPRLFSTLMSSFMWKKNCGFFLCNMNGASSLE